MPPPQTQITQPIYSDTGFSQQREITVTVSLSKTVLFLNCCSLFDLVCKEDYTSICTDFHLECAKYGTVVDVVIPQPQRELIARLTNLDLERKGSGATSGDDADNIDWRSDIEKERETEAKAILLGTPAKIFVKFSNEYEAQMAVQAMLGMTYQGRMVVTAYFNEDYGISNYS
ncbi:MAG: hypothetical protein EZS28_032460, partial [Streblomastix strix]